MRGMGAFRMAQMKHRDARVFALCRHLRSAIDIFEQIAAEPYRPPEKPALAPVSQPVALPPRELPPWRANRLIRGVRELWRPGNS